MENKMVEKTMETIGNVTKLAANLTVPVPKTLPPVKKPDDNSNKATTGTQSVNVLVDSGKKKDPKPVEKHIHEFPDNRALTEQECELALKKAQMDYELKKSDQVYYQKYEERSWQHRLEQEKKNERKAKIRRIFGGILVAIGVGTVGYSIYTDYRNNKNTTATPKTVPETSTNDPINTEGTVN